MAGYRLRVADEQPTFWAKVEAGIWEPGTCAVIRERVRRGTTFLDLGAWVGPTTLLAASQGADVIAVEADPAALDQLRGNIACNPDLADRIAVIPRAVAAARGTVRLGARRKPGDSMSSTLLADAAESWLAETVTPEELAERVGSATDLFIKLDIEGGEFALFPHLLPLFALPGTRALLVSFHPAILGDEAAACASIADALALLDGWEAFEVAGGEVRRTRPQAAAIAARRQSDEWLFAQGG